MKYQLAYCSSTLYLSSQNDSEGLLMFNFKSPLLFYLCDYPHLYITLLFALYKNSLPLKGAAEVASQHFT